MLLQVGKRGTASRHDATAQPTRPRCSDVFFRVGGPHVGKATTALEVNSDDVLIDHTWVWRADHGVDGAPAGRCNTGRQRRRRQRRRRHGDRPVRRALPAATTWSGTASDGTTILYQNELPYDPPTQADWLHDGVEGYAGYKVADTVQDATGCGGGVYCFFNDDPTIHTENGVRGAGDAGRAAAPHHDRVTSNAAARSTTWSTTSGRRRRPTSRSTRWSRSPSSLPTQLGSRHTRWRLPGERYSPVTDLEAGWQALSRGKWDEALEYFHRDGDDPEALEGIGVAQWWLDDADATLAARGRAYRLFRAGGDRVGAARVASSLAWDSLLFGGRPAVARGWLERAARLLADEPTRAEHAWLAVREAEVALNSGTPEVARAAAERAIAIGEQTGDEDVQVVGRSLEGVALVQEGAIAEGMRRLDESAAAATAGEIVDLMWTSKVCCNLISACESVGDVERATQWCDEVKEYAERWELRTLFNVCRTQYAAVLLQQGTWHEAEQELTAAIDVLGSGRRAALVEGTARLGELRRRQGRLDEARKLFAQSELNFVARMGMVELALDAATRRPLWRSRSASSERPTSISVSRGSRYCCSLVRAAVAAGRLETARTAAVELERLAGLIDTNGAHAAAARGGRHSPPGRRRSGDRDAAARRRGRSLRARARSRTSARTRAWLSPARSASSVPPNGPSPRPTLRSRPSRSSPRCEMRPTPRSFAGC